MIMLKDNQGLDDKYRPRSFHDVWGQEMTVRILSRLAARSLGRNLLLRGDYGSGKTSLVHIYARALNCEAPSKTGSPCNQCDACSSAKFLLEYDTPARGGSLSEVNAFLEHVPFIAKAHRWTVCFFDECHALSRAACDALLKRLERRDLPIVYAFATTDPSSLDSAFLSRLTKLNVRPLNHLMAMTFLENIAQREGIAYTRAGLSLLAAVERGHPRSLLNGLEKVALASDVLDVEAVRLESGIETPDYLAGYLLALARGDGEKQVTSLRDWPGLMEDKIRAVRGLLATCYYNDILGYDVAIDPLAYSMVDQRAEIISAFCAKWHFTTPSDMKEPWLRMIQFWTTYPVASPSSVLAFPMFEDLVNRCLANPEASVEKLDVPGAAASIADRQWSIGERAMLPGVSAEPLSDDHYVEASDVREIVNRASAFIQQQGECLNLSLLLFPHNPRETEAAVIVAIKRFLQSLEGAFTKSHSPYAAVVTYESDRDGVAGRILAHIPALQADDRQRAVFEFCRDYRDEGSTHVKATFAPGPGRKMALQFHWRQVFDLCGGFKESESVLDDSMDGFLPNLKRHRRQSAPTRHKPVEFRGLLNQDAMEDACVNGLAFVSAFDARVWEKINSGWEFEEYLFRLKTAQYRRQRIAELEHLWGGTPRFDAERARLQEAWLKEASVRRVARGTEVGTRHA